MGPQHFSLEQPAVGQPDAHCVGAGDDVGGGEDESVGAIDHARAEALRRLELHDRGAHLRRHGGDAFRGQF